MKPVLDGKEIIELCRTLVRRVPVADERDPLLLSV